MTSAAVHWCCITAHLCEQQISIGVIAETQASCELGLQSSNEQWGSCLALTSAAVLWCCITAYLCEEQISIGLNAVIAVSQFCCQLGLQGSTEQWGSCLAMTSTGVHWCCITAHLCEDQVSIGVIAETQASRELGLQSSNEQWGSCLAMTSTEVHWCCITAHLYEEQISIGLNAVIAVSELCCQLGLQSSNEQWASCLALTSDAVHWCCIAAHLCEEQMTIGVIAMTQASCELGLQSSTEQW